MTNQYRYPVHRQQGGGKGVPSYSVRCSEYIPPYSALEITGLDNNVYLVRKPIEDNLSSTTILFSGAAEIAANTVGVAYSPLIAPAFAKGTFALEQRMGTGAYSWSLVVGNIGFVAYGIQNGEATLVSVVPTDAPLMYKVNSVSADTRTVRIQAIDAQGASTGVEIQAQVFV